MATEVVSSHCRPKVIVPRQRRDTLRPVWPRRPWRIGVREYHRPLLVDNRFVQLDHMTRGRTMLGCGPGALVSDAYMLAIEPVTQRPRMEEALDAIMQLLRCEEPVTLKTDWFELREARLHLAPYTEPHFPIAVASTITPAGVVAAGKHGLGVLSIGAGLPGGPEP